VTRHQNTSVARVTVSVESLERALPLYEGVLGLTRRYALEDVVILRTGHPAVEVLLHQRSPDPGNAGVAMSFTVPDVDETTRRATAAGGAAIAEPPTPQPLGGRQSVLRDADGHLLCLISPESQSHDRSPARPADVVRAVATGVGRLTAGDLTPKEREEQLDRLAACYAEHTDVRHPMALTAGSPLRTRVEVREHFARAATRLAGLEHFETVDAVVYTTEDPEVVIFEFGYAICAGGHEFTVPNIYVVRVREGQIVESRDYTDHVAMARGLGRLDALLAVLTA
jgi:predicted enzyme related to lactoylglutathione lyase/ketosteroid isomerase-like protein